MIDTFNANLVPGNLKAMMREVNAPSRDLWQVAVGDINVLKDFNVRTDDESLRLHIRTLANSMKVEGYYQDKPLGGYVAREGDKQVIYIRDGHCRFAAAMLAISEGAEITRLPVVIAPQGTSMEDLTVALVKSNSGKPLTPFEVGMVCKRLIGFGWDTKAIAGRLDYSEAHVGDLLMLMAAPTEVRTMVQDGTLSASTAITALQDHGANTLAVLKAGEKLAKESGTDRVTAKHLPGAAFKKAVKSSAEQMFDLLMEIDAAGLLAGELSKKVNAVIDPVYALKPGATT